MYRPDSIIFDVDGTLWDSRESVAAAWNHALRRNSDLDITLEPESLGKLFGKTMTEIADALFPCMEPAARMALLEKCYEYENLYLEDHPGILYEGVRETIQALALEYPLYIVSNCQCGYIEVLLKTTGLSSCIRDHLCFGETLTPKSETIRKLAERNRLKAPVYVGDTQGDADSCAAAGIPFIFASYGLGDVPDAGMRIERFSELRDIRTFFS